MNFVQLKFVKATAELESFSKASSICNVTQPSLSNGISKLEQELGQKIFDRTTRSVKLTPFGEHLLPVLLSILRLEEVARLSAKTFSNSEITILKIGMSPLLNANIISLLTTSFAEKNNHIRIVLIEDNLEVLEAKLKNQDLDIIIIPKIKRVSNHQTIKLYDEDLYLVGQQSAQQQVDVNEIRDRTFVMVPDSCGLSFLTRSIIRTTKSSIKEYQGKAMSYQVLSDWASNGFGSAILPKSKIPHNKPKQLLLRAKKPIKITYEAHWLKRDNPALQQLTTFFESHISAICNGISDALN